MDQTKRVRTLPINLTFIHPYSSITCIFISLGVLSYFSPLPEIKPHEGGESPTGSSDYAKSKTSIFQFPHLLLGVLALFFDMGLETIALGTINDCATILELPILYSLAQ